MATPPDPSANMISGYISLLPIFKGDSTPPTIIDFFILFEEIAALAQWNSSQKLILAKSRCRDAALQYLLDSVDVKSVTDFVQFKTLMIERFRERVPVGQRMQEFLTCIQKGTEPVAQFATRLKKFSTHLEPQLAEKISPEARAASRKVIESLLLGQFLAGIKPSIRRFVLAQNPPTLDKAIEVATQEEVNDSITRQIARIRLVDQAEPEDGANTNSEGQVAQLLPTRNYWRQPKTLPLCLHPQGTCVFEKTHQLPSDTKRRKPGGANSRFMITYGKGRARFYKGNERRYDPQLQRPGEITPRVVPVCRGRPVEESRPQYGRLPSPPRRYRPGGEMHMNERKKKTPTRRIGRASCK